MKKSFVLYNDQEEIFTELSNEQAGLLIKSIFKFNKTGEMPKDPIIKLIFISIKQTLIRDTEKWENIRDRNIQNGKLGGRPSLNNNPENPVGYLGTQNNPEKPRKPVSVSVSVSDNVNDITTNKLVGKLSVYGKPEINFLIDYLKEKMELPKLDLSDKLNRRYAQLLLNKSKKGVDGIKWLIDIASNDSWFKVHTTSFRDLWSNQVKIISCIRKENKENETKRAVYR